MGNSSARRLTALVVALALSPLAAAAPAAAGPEGYALATTWDAVANKDVAAAPDGTVWSVDGFSTLNHFTSTGTLLTSFTLSGFSSAKGIAVGPDGTLYITEAEVGSPSVLAFTPSGHPGATFTLSDEAVALGVDVAPTGEVLVTNASTDRVEVFSATGTWLRNIGSSGAGPGQVDRPDDVVVASDGTVFVSDYWNHRVQRFALATGAYLGGFGQPGTGPGQLDTPYAVDLTPTGNVMVLDKNALQEFKPDGTFVSRTNHGLSMLYDDQGMSVDASGAVYATRTGGLARFAPVAPAPTPQPQPGAKAGKVAVAKPAIPVRGKRGRLTLSCRDGATCAGTVKITSPTNRKLVLARGTYSLGTGTSIAKVTVTRKGRGLLARRSTVKVKVALTASGSTTPVTARAKLVRAR